MIEEKIIEFLKYETKLDNIGIHDSFIGYIDSITFVKLVIFVEETWNISICNEYVNFNTLKNIEILSEFVKKMI